MQTAKSPQTERVTFLTSREHKAALDAFAERTGQSMGNVLREASTLFIGKVPESEEAELAELAALVTELAKAVPEMKASLQRTADNMERTTNEVNSMLREAGLRK